MSASVCPPHLLVLPSGATAIAAKRLGHMGGWKVGPEADQEVFAASEYREHAQLGDYTRSVTVAEGSS